MLVELPLRGHGDVHVGIFKIIFVLRRAVFIDGCRIGQLVVHVVHARQSLGQVILVRDVVCRSGNLPGGVGIWAEHRAFRPSEEVERSHRTLVIALRRTLVFQVARHVTVRRVEAHEKPLEHVDVRVEPNVQAVHVVLVQHTVRPVVAQGQEIAGNVIATLHRDAVVL